LRDNYVKIYGGTKMKKRGFTLVEMLVVLGIIALLSAILLPLFKGLRESVYKEQCVANLQKIYHALRMFYLDTGTYPEAPITLQNGQVVDLGLLALHSDDLVNLVAYGYSGLPLNDPDEARRILSRKGRYPIFPSEFHCPANIQHDKPIVENNGAYYIDPYYFDYVSIDPLLGVSTYMRVRTRDNLDPNFKKQLYAKEPLNSTVITWCYSHRDLDANGLPRSGSKDIVLFLDGHTEVRETSEMMIVDPITGLYAPWLIEPRRR
jgi:type IV pilus assembly protein PilA